MKKTIFFFYRIIVESIAIELQSLTHNSPASKLSQNHWTKEANNHTPIIVVRRLWLNRKSKRMKLLKRLAILSLDSDCARIVFLSIGVYTN